MRKTECPHRQPLSAVGDLWVDVALKQLHILARPFPQGQPPPMPLVSRAFPQEVTSALATHGVVPVTSVAYEQALDGHLGGSMKLHILASLPGPCEYSILDSYSKIFVLLELDSDQTLL